MSGLDLLHHSFATFTLNVVETGRVEKMTRLSSIMQENKSMCDIYLLSYLVLVNHGLKQVQQAFSTKVNRFASNIVS